MLPVNFITADQSDGVGPVDSDRRLETVGGPQGVRGTSRPWMDGVTSVQRCRGNVPATGTIRATSAVTLNGSATAPHPAKDVRHDDSQMYDRCAAIGTLAGADIGGGSGRPLPVLLMENSSLGPSSGAPS
jgi:hypothetical protein